jgi:hypothetical protein
VLPKLVPEALGQNGVVGLGCGVVADHGRALKATHGRHQDDPALPALDEPPPEVVGHTKRTGDVDVDRLEVLFHVDLEEGPDGRVRSIVDQQADVQVPGRRTHPCNHIGRAQVEGLHLHFYAMLLAKLGSHLF